MKPISFRMLIVLLTLVAPVALPARSHGEGKDKDKQEEQKEAEVKFAQLKLSGAMDEGLAPVVPLAPAPPNFRGVLQLIQKAGEDPELEGVLLEVKAPRIGFAKVNQLNRELRKLKQKGKKIYLHAEQLDTLTLMLGSLSHRVSIPESGWVLMPGLSAEMMYFRELFDLLGIRFDVTHVGDYKSAYENFAKEQMSDELREVLDAILDEFWDTMVGLVAEGRGIPRATVEKAINQGFQTPEDARRAGLIDAVEYEDEFRAWLKNQYPGKKLTVLKKYGKPEQAELDFNNPFAIFSQLAQMMNPSASARKETEEPKLALIYAVGQIVSGKSQVDPFTGQTSTMGSDTMVKAIRKAAEDDTVKAIVMRVDSPGGSGLASDMIWREVIRAKEKKPFIVSMSDVAGSGGYYISMAADAIVAEPTTLTGSIGVVSMFLDLTRLTRRVGIHIEAVSRGDSAGLFSPFVTKDEHTRERFASYMRDFYVDFVTKVADGRSRDFEEIEKLARGRVWTGRQAKKVGLVDELGGIDTALALARSKGKLGEDCPIVEYPEPQNFFDALSEMLEGGLARVSAGEDTTRSALLEALPPGTRTLLLTDTGRKILRRLQTVYQVACTEGDRRLLLVPFDVVFR